MTTPPATTPPAAEPGTAVRNAHGANNVNTGPGTQINNIVEWVERRRRAARFVADEHIEWLAARFVRPGRFPEHALDQPGTVVLTGPDGSGRRSAALVLLAGFGTHTVRVLADHDDTDQRALDPDEIAEGERLLLDLTGTDRERVLALQPELEAYRAAVSTRGARLAVVVRTEQVRLLADSLAVLVNALDPPSRGRVLRAHLRLGEFPVPADVEEHLAGASLREVAELARLALDARAADPDAGPAQWLRTARTAQEGREAAAAELFAKHPDAASRALVVVAAFLPGAPLEALARAEARFRDLVELPDDDGHALDGVYLAERIRRVGLRVDDGREVSFTALALDGAVRTHFWTYFPQLRDKTRAWVEAAVALPEVDDRTATGLVERFADQVLATGPVDLLTGPARRWSADGTRPDLALAVLGAGLRHPRWSWAFRDHVYQCSRVTELNPMHARLLVTACAVLIAPTWPTQALVRLHHFTRHRDEEVRAEARQALLDLVHRRGLQRRLLYRFAKSGVREEDHAILRDLALPPRLAHERHTRAHLLATWAQVLGSGASPQVPHHLLDQDPLLLVEACAGRVRAFGDLYAAVQWWVRAGVDVAERRRRSAVAAWLQRHIDSALDAGTGAAHQEGDR